VSEALNPKFRREVGDGFRQTRWLMRGDDCCDHSHSAPSPAARAVRNR